jgi:uracil-DNA glycosylase family 4
VNYEAFDKLCSKVRFCTVCPRMDASQRVLGRAAGPIDARLMFIGEAPGRLGADASGIPFHGDKAGHNFEALLEFARLSRRNIFVTNAVLCNPRDDQGNNTTPRRDETKNCSSHLRAQIDIVAPSIVVTLGAVALDALRSISPHDLQLASSVRTAHSWYGRKLIPLYHPGQRAMVHRSLSNQRSDYQFVAEQFRRIGKPRAAPSGTVRSDIAAITREILSAKRKLSYFALHKLFYLVEYEAAKQYGHPLTTAFFVRQKDGPYCTDLHLFKVRKAIPELTVSRDGLSIELMQATKALFRGDGATDAGDADAGVRNFVSGVVARYANLSDAALKTKVYLTSPMREILRQEREQLTNLYNTPIELVRRASAGEHRAGRAV